MPPVAWPDDVAAPFNAGRFVDFPFDCVVAAVVLSLKLFMNILL